MQSRRPLNIRILKSERYLLIPAFLLVFSFFCQSKETIYLFPGQGSDYRIFSELTFDTSLFDVTVIEYAIPEKSMTLQEYAKELSARIG